MKTFTDKTETVSFMKLYKILRNIFLQTKKTKKKDLKTFVISLYARENLTRISYSCNGSFTCLNIHEQMLIKIKEGNNEESLYIYNSLTLTCRMLSVVEMKV